MTPTHSFKTNEFANNVQIYGGLAIGVAYIFLLLAFPRMPGYHLGLIIMIIALGVWNASRSPVKFYDDHMEIKVAPASSLRMIRYSDISGLDNSHPKRVQISYRENGKEKMLKVPWAALEKRAKTALVPLLRTKRKA